MIIKKIILIFFFLTFSSVNAKEALDIVVGLERPPYISKANNSGYELELVSAILAKLDKSANFLFAPFGRSEKMLINNNVDGMTTTNAQMITNEKLLTEPYVVYHNVAISLSDNNLNIREVADLSHYSIATFEEAHKVLGKEFTQAIAKSPMYTQVANRTAQLELLFRKRVEVIVMDINIFNYYFEANKEKFRGKSYQIHDIFARMHYQMAFKNHQLVNKFNRAYEEYIQTEGFKALQNKYNLLQYKQEKLKTP